METEIKIKEYNLPDSSLYMDQQPHRGYMVWIPDFISVVLGSSNKPENSINIKNIIKDNIPVYKRPSGGETVLLSPNTLIISAVMFREKMHSAKKYFIKYNEIIQRALIVLGVENVKQKGISDLSIDNQKICGSAIYQNKERVFFHAVLNIKESSSLIEKYLIHPQREPDYRQGRKHKYFVTSLINQNYNLTMSEIKNEIEKKFVAGENTKTIEKDLLCIA